MSPDPVAAEGGGCLVIGGGLLGSHTAVEFAARGRSVTVYSRSFSPWLLEQQRNGLKIELVGGTLPEADNLPELIDAAEIVLFLAGASTPQLAANDAVVSVAASLEPGLAVLDLMRTSTTARVVIASSGGTVYGGGARVPTPEASRLSPISLHGVNSLAIEQYAMFYAREHGLDPVILRYSNAYGPGGRSRHGQGVVAAWCEALARDEPLALIGDGSVRRDFVFAADAARATVAAAIDAPGREVYNVGGGESRSLRDVLALLQQVSGRRARISHAPARPIDVPVTELDCSRLHDLTGWRAATTFEDGLCATWTWALAQHESRTAVTMRCP